MGTMSNKDADRVYLRLPDTIRRPIEQRALDRAVEEATEAPVGVSREQMNAATVTFEFDEFYRRCQWVEDTSVDMDISEMHHPRGLVESRVVDAIRAEIVELQKATAFSPREFVALVLAGQGDESEAARKMGVSVGTVRGKKGRIEEKVEEAERTLSLVESLRDTAHMDDEQN